jgi:hypothetical protein
MGKPSLLDWIRWLNVWPIALTFATGPALAYDWLQFGGDPQHSSRNTAESAIRSSNVATLGQRYQVLMPGAVDGAPVFLEGVNTSVGVKDLLFVTTRDGRIIAFDAQTGAQVWSQQYGPGNCRINLNSGACYTTSSPAIDPNRQYVYSYGLDGYVHKYQVGDGTEISTDGWPQLATWKGYDEKGSSALAIATSGGSTYLYAVQGGYPGDNGDYQGHVTVINLATGGQRVFNMACSDQTQHFKHLADQIPPTCATPRNAVWSRPGVVYDAGTDRILMATGNGVYDGNNGGHNWSESVIALHPDGSGGSGGNLGEPLDSYTPANFQLLDNADADIGSTAPAVLPVPANSNVQHLAVQGGKDGRLRLLNLADLSSQGGPGRVGGEVGAVINVPQGGGLFSQPAVWVNPFDSSTWVFVVNASGASAMRLLIDGSGNPSLGLQWQNGASGTSPIIANGVLFFIASSTIQALDPLSGNTLWSIARSGDTHWQSLIVANGAVYATDNANGLAAFTLPALPPTMTTLSSSANPAQVGTMLTLTTTVTGTNPSGNVNFRDSGTSLAGCGAVALAGSGNARTATCNGNSLTIGTHSIVASYGGDAGNAASSSAPLSQVIVGAGLSNGGFEIPSLAGGYQFSPSGATWAFVSGGGISGNSTAFTSGDPPAPEGVQVAFLQNGGAMAQTVNITPGQYTLSFKAAQRGNYQVGTQVVQVQVDGVAVGQYQPPNTAYSSYQTPPFTIATSGNHTVTLAGVGTGSDFTAFIDDVRLSSSASGSDVVWLEDSMPAGAIAAGDGGDAWSWISANPAPYSGALAHQAVAASGEHQHYFYDATSTLAGAMGDALFAYVYLDPANLPSEVMPQWNDGSREHRAY